MTPDELLGRLFKYEMDRTVSSDLSYLIQQARIVISNDFGVILNLERQIHGQRGEYAKAAMQGLAAGIGWDNGRMFNMLELASDAVACADALIAELQKEPSK